MPFPKSRCKLQFKYLNTNFNIVKIYFHINNMTTYMMRQNNSFPNSSSSGNNRKKIKHYSYSIFDKIGKGFSSVVYKGTNDTNNQVVAIKAIDMKGVKDAVSREMLDCEIEALTKLKHPNILKCFDVVRETSHCFIITEFCNEGDLSSYLKKRKRMTEAEVSKILKNIVQGFLQIGQNKFLHRDLKLANIFMNDGIAKIADFGFAKKSHASFEKQKYNVGSPLYMSPEALKKNIYSTKNDIWSIGIMIFELLHGQTPWECRTETELIDKMTRIPVKFKDSLNISAEVKHFIKKCLQVDQSKRMNLADMRQFSKTFSNRKSQSIQNLPEKQNTIQQQIKTGRQTQKVIRPLGDATNRVSLGVAVEKNRSYSNVYQKYTNQVRNNNSFVVKDKENTLKPEEKKKLSKTLIDKNNSVLLIQINKFRLFYKIYEKLKNLSNVDKTIMDSLGNEILKRVEDISSILLSAYSQNFKGKSKAEELGLKDIESYLREDVNSGIKKYKSVIKEYQKKYTSEIMIGPSASLVTIPEAFKKFLSSYKSGEFSKEECQIVYWMLESVKFKENIQKDELDSIIESKTMPSKQVLAAKLKELV